jgi:hypothetical protein
MVRMISKTEINKLPQNPIFIVGFPRSGTTLLQSMLATQANIYSFPETHYFCTTKRFIETDKNGSIDIGCLEMVFQNIKEKTEYEFSPDIKKELSDAAVAHKLSVKQLFEYLVTGLLIKQVETEQLPTIRWVEKTPGHIFYLDFIHDFYPKARFIEIVRSPLNAIFSSKTRFDELNHVTPSALALRWKNSLATFNQFKEENPEKAFSVKYENLANDPEDEFRTICEFLKIVPNIEKLKDIQRVTPHLVLEKETWKTKNLSNGINKVGANYKWGGNEELKMKYLLREEIIEMGYSDGYSLLQLAFNQWMYLVGKLTSLRSLSPLKGPAKYLLKKVGLWPYQK